MSNVIRFSGGNAARAAAADTVNRGRAASHQQYIARCTLEIIEANLKAAQFSSEIILEVMNRFWGSARP